MESTTNRVRRIISSRVAPAPTSFELHLNPSPDFTREGWGRKVKAVEGKFAACRGHTDIRFVTVPNTDAGQKLADELVQHFPKHKRTTVICRGTGVSGDASSWITVQRVASFESSAPTEVVLDKYNAAFLDAVEDRGIDIAPSCQELIKHPDTGYYHFRSKVQPKPKLTAADALRAIVDARNANPEPIHYKVKAAIDAAREVI